MSTDKLREALQQFLDWSESRAPCGDPSLQELTRAKKAARAALAETEQRPVAVPAGWKLVPAEPSADMRNAYHAVTDDDVTMKGAAGSRWAAMLAAAPTPPAQPAAQPLRCRKCGGTMKPGQALAQTTSTSHEGTCSPGGPGALIDCMKCERCGWSVTGGAATQPLTDADCRDAERYRWLRDGDLGGKPPYPIARMFTAGYSNPALWGEELDAAIDAAMSAKGR